MISIKLHQQRSHCLFLLLQNFRYHVIFWCCRKQPSEPPQICESPSNASTASNVHPSFEISAAFARRRFWPRHKPAGQAISGEVKLCFAESETCSATRHGQPRSVTSPRRHTPNPGRSPSPRRLTRHRYGPQHFRPYWSRETSSPRSEIPPTCTAENAGAGGRRLAPPRLAPPRGGARPRPSPARLFSPPRDGRLAIKIASPRRTGLETFAASIYRVPPPPRPEAAALQHGAAALPARDRSGTASVTPSPGAGHTVSSPNLSRARLKAPSSLPLINNSKNPI